MKYSDKLNGFWEEGYHYYMEFRGGRLTVRNYRREITLETGISYDARALENGERTVISLKDNVLSRDGRGNPFTMVRELAYENGELKMLYYYTIMGETLYTLKKVDHGPFDHIIIRDKEYLPRLQGRWEMWCRDGSEGQPLIVKNDRVLLPSGSEEKFHVISYTYDRDHVWMVPANLIDQEFRGYTEIEVLPDKLTTRMQICDARVPLTVFARKEMMDKIVIPPEAKIDIVSTMVHEVPPPCVDETPLKKKE